MADEEKQPRRGILKIVLIVVVIMLLVIGGGIFAAIQFLGLGAGNDEPAPPGPLHEMEEFTVNLQERGILQLRVVLDLEDEDQIEEISAYETAIRDEIIAILRRHSVEDLEGDDAYRGLKEDITQRINEIVPGEEIEGVYFTEFIISG